ncbi:MAG TPA: hypothetical protein VGS21_06915 [Acidimicrobiales bacterium]|nr:hypothetical protein [Acidimicrobiales bacterium]
MKHAAFDLLLALHIVTSILGFGAVIATGCVALSALRAGTTPGVVRYFREGPNWLSLSVLTVPAFGAGVALLGTDDVLRQLWPWLALGVWLVAAVVGLAVHWPAERAIQRSISGGSGPSAELAVECRRAAASAGVMTAVFVVCVALMVVQPR